MPNTKAEVTEVLENEGPGLSYDDSVEKTAGALVHVDDVMDEDTTVQLSNRKYSATIEDVLDRDDLAVPKLRLAQGIMTEVQEGRAKSGDFLLEGNRPVQEVLLVPLAMAKVREYRDPGDNTNMLCKSDDGKVGVGVPGGACEVCPLSMWTDGPIVGGKQKRKSPLCTKIYSYIFWSETHQAVVTFDFKRTSERCGQTMNVIFGRYGRGNVAVTLSSKLQKMGPATVSVPNVEVTDVPEEILDRAKISF